MITRNLLLFLCVTFSCGGLAQTLSVDATVVLLEGPPAELQAGESGSISFEISNLGPDPGLLRLFSDFGLEGEIPVALFEEQLDDPFEQPSCFVSQSIANPTPFLSYSLVPAPSSEPFQTTETRVCRVDFDIPQGAPEGIYSVLFETRLRFTTMPADDPNTGNNSVEVQWNVVSGGGEPVPRANGIPANGLLTLILLATLIVVFGGWFLRGKYPIRS